MPFLGNFQGSFFAGERSTLALFCSCDKPGGKPSTPESNVVSILDKTVTGSLTGGSVWGSNPYTNDSDLNVAAVHAGLVGVGETAVITLFSPDDYAAKAPGYLGTSRNNIQTTPWHTTWCGFYIRRKSVGVLNGVASADQLVQYFGPKPGSSFQFITQAGTNNISVNPIPYGERGGAGFIEMITKDIVSGSSSIPNGIGYAGSVDDGYYSIPISLINFLGQSYKTVYVGTNFYITFGGGSSGFSGLNYANPPFPKIMIGAGDHSIQRIYYGTNPIFTFVRVEGIKGLTYVDPSGILPNNSPNYPGGPYSSGDGPMVYEMYIYNNALNYIIDLHIIANATWS